MRFSITKNPRIVDLAKLYEIAPHEGRRMAEAIDRLFRQHEGRLFASEGAHGGAGWAPLSPRYKAWKRKRYPGRKILVRTGELRKRLVNLGPSHIAEWRPVGREVVVGADTQVGAWHKTGTSRMPARDPIQHQPAQLLPYSEAIKKVLRLKLERVALVMSAWGQKQ